MMFCMSHDLDEVGGIEIKRMLSGGGERGIIIDDVLYES